LYIHFGRALLVTIIVNFFYTYILVRVVVVVSWKLIIYHIVYECPLGKRVGECGGEFFGTLYGPRDGGVVSVGNETLVPERACIILFSKD
jgi:hypothetical protein